MMIFLFGVLNDEQRALVERIFHEHRVHFQRISFKIVKSEEAAEDVVSTAFVKIIHRSFRRSGRRAEGGQAV